jgi:DNA-binding MarR family transcriptional regulator
MIVNLVNDLSTETLDQTEVANRLRPALLKVARELRRESHALGVRAGHATLLIQIQRNRGIGVNELAAREHVSPAAMSAHIRRLARAGLVQRTPDTRDRRRHGLSVTAEGERVLRSVKSRRTAWLAARLRQLEPEQLRVLDAAVEPLLELVEKR